MFAVGIGHVAQRGTRRECGWVDSGRCGSYPLHLAVGNDLGRDHGPAQVGTGEQFQRHRLGQHRREAVQVGPRVVNKVDARAGCAQCICRRHAVMGIHISASAAHDLRQGRGATDQHYGLAKLRAQRQSACFVLQQHRTLGAEPADQRAVGGKVVGPFGRNHRVGKAAQAIGQLQHTTGAGTHRVGGQAAVAHGGHQLVAALARRAGHLQVAASEHALHGVVLGSNQSDITRPSKPHSSRSISVTRRRWSAMKLPSTRL